MMSYFALWGNFEEKDEFILFFKSSNCKIASTARNWIKPSPLTAVTTFAISSVLILLLCSPFFSNIVNFAHKGME